MRRMLMLLAVAVIGAGCTSAVTLRHPQTGQTVKCGPYYVETLTYGGVVARERGCIADYQRQGYERVPD